jgi:hypothetical protein
MRRIVPLLILCLPVAAVAQSLTPTLVARTGQAVADVGGATYTTIGVLPRLGPNGHVAFSGFYTPGSGPGGSIDFGYWVGTPGNLQLAVGENSSSDLFPGNANVGVDANGNISIWTQLGAEPANQNQVLNTFVPDGGTTLVAKEGITAAPGFAGGLYSAIGSGHASNNDGAVAFTGSVTGGDVTGISNDSGLFTGTPGSLTLVAREGASAPGAGGTAPVFSVFYDKRINASGQVGFAVDLANGVGGSLDRAFYVWSPTGGGTLELAAQEETVAPGTSPTIKFLLMDDQPGFNDAGQVAFRSSLTSDVPGEITVTNNYGIWAGEPGSVQLIARSGNASPIAGLQFRTPYGNPRINGSGQVAFFTVVSGPGVGMTNDNVFWLTTPEGTEVVIREGDAAPGTPAGVNINGLDPLAVINGAGQVAFTATLTGTGVTGLNDRGLWAGEPGDLSLIAREGDVIDVDPGAGEILKTISAISFANGYGSTPADSASAAFNDAGQIAWRALFSDASTAVFLTSLPSSPSLPGDFNNNGTVDAGDYVVWRKNDGTNNALPNDGGLGTPIGPLHYALWRTNFGNPPGSGAARLTSMVAVPEPSGCTFAALFFLTTMFARRWR